jgi:hypothetical protein
VSLLDKIKGLFGKTPLPEETQLLLSGVADVDSLRQGLDEIVTRNEVEARDIEREIEKLARMESDQKERVQTGDLNKREKLNVLREIKRLRRRMDSLEKRHRIHQDNIDLHLGLFDRITEMQAMEMKKVSQAQIEEMSADYDEAMDKHRDLMATARAASGMEGGLYEDSAEQAELAALEAEILAEVGGSEDTEEAAETPEVEVPAREAPQVEAPQTPKQVEVKVEAKVEPKVETAAASSASARSAARRRSLDAELAAMEAELDDIGDFEDERALELE